MADASNSPLSASPVSPIGQPRRKTCPIAGQGGNFTINGSGYSAAGVVIDAARGAVVLDGDRLGHEILARAGVLAEIERVFGGQYLQDGVVNRPLLGRLVFSDAAALQKLNDITHDRLARLMEQRLAEREAGAGPVLAVLEAAVYFLLPQPPRADLVVLVTAAEALRAGRLTARGMTTTDARARIDRQRSMEAAFAGADVVIPNEGDLDDLAVAVDRLLAEHRPDGIRGANGNKEEELK